SLPRKSEVRRQKEKVISLLSALDARRPVPCTRQSIGTACHWNCISAASRIARPLPRGFTGHVAHPSRSIRCESNASRAKVTATAMAIFFSSVFAFLFLALLLLLPARARAISTSHLRMLPSHLTVTRHLIHRVRSMSSPSGSGHFSGVHFRLVSAHV